MEIHILLAGVEFGPYTDDKARQLLDEGFLSSNDPAKRLDEQEWIPLSTLLARSSGTPSNLKSPAPHATGHKDGPQGEGPSSVATTAPSESPPKKDTVSEMPPHGGYHLR